MGFRDIIRFQGSTRSFGSFWKQRFGSKGGGGGRWRVVVALPRGGSGGLRFFCDISEGFGKFTDDFRLFEECFANFRCITKSFGGLASGGFRKHLKAIQNMFIVSLRVSESFRQLQGHSGLREFQDPHEATLKPVEETPRNLCNTLEPPEMPPKTYSSALEPLLAVQNTPKNTLTFSETFRKIFYKPSVTPSNPRIMPLVCIPLLFLWSH